MLWMWEEVCTNKRTWITWESSHWRRPFPCPTCHKRFGRKGGLQLQVGTHIGERMSACSKGTSHLPVLRSLKRRNHLHALNVTRGLQTQEKKRVMLIHKSLKTIKEHTLVKNCLHAHLATGHSPERKNRWELTQMRIEKPFECPTYNMRFTWKEPLETHEKTHEWARIDEKPFECPTCNMRFTGKEQLETHEKPHWRAHSGEKPHPCEQCKTSSISASMFKSLLHLS